MPLHSLHHLAPAAALGLWHRTEAPATLWPLLPSPASYQTLLPATAGPERQAQWLAGRVLVHQLLKALGFANAPLVLHNEPSGRPQLLGQPAAPVVSLSHSGEWVAALLAPAGRVGIDIEQVRPKAQRIAPKFLSAPDLQAAEAQAQAGPNPAAYFSLLWSAKETLYKLAGRSGIIFKEQLLLDDFTPHLHPPPLLPSHPPAPETSIPATLILDGHATRHRVCYTVPAPGYVLTYCYEPGLISEF